jgi:hypothetical protein
MLMNALTNGVLVGAMLMCATVASAQDLGRQTVNFTLGYFTPVGFDGRDIDDVLSVNSTFLLFDIDDFNGASVGGEWLFPLARHIEGGIGVSYSSKPPAASMRTSSIRMVRDRSGSAFAPGAAGVHGAADSRQSELALPALRRRRYRSHQLALQ